MARYTNGDELMLEIESQIRITKSKYRELDPNDVIYNPKLIKSKDYFDGMIDTLYWVQARVLANASTADVREVIEADGYQHLICPHCLSEFYSKTKAEMFCPNCGKKFFFSEKWYDFVE